MSACIAWRIIRDKIVEEFKKSELLYQKIILSTIDSSKIASTSFLINFVWFIILIMCQQYFVFVILSTLINAEKHLTCQRNSLLLRRLYFREKTDQYDVWLNFYDYYLSFVLNLSSEFTFYFHGSVDWINLISFLKRFLAILSINVVWIQWGIRKCMHEFSF